LLLAIWVLATWVADCVVGPTFLNLWGPCAAEMPLMDVLSSLCRRPLRMVEPSISHLSRLPLGLSPTLLMIDPDHKSLSKLIDTFGHAATYFFSAHKAVQVRCPILASTRTPAGTGLRIALCGIRPQMARISKSQARALAEYFQPRFLQFRLTHHIAIANSVFDADVSPALRQIARIFGAVLEGAPDLQERMVEALNEME